MSLSVCMITAEPATQVAAVLAPLREIADEIVIAADRRVDARTLGAYASIADLLLRIEYRQMERHLGWLYAQCSADWILRMDGDEVVSAALVRRLPALMASRDVAQYCVPQAWCFPNGRHILDEAPWAADFNNRLLRNTGDALRFGGEQHLHAVPATPLGYEPQPVYHLDLLLNSLDERRSKAVRYEVARPGLIAQGGGRFNEAFYLPELRRRPPELRQVPEEDIAAIERVLAATAATAVPSHEVDLPVVPLAELDRFWPGRTTEDTAYRARIEVYGHDHRLEPGATGTFFVTVVNEGTERWSHLLEEPPCIRLSYRLHRADGGLLAEGPRTAFTRPVAPGDEVLTPLNVAAPGEPGDYVVDVDVVHEHVRWFGADCRFTLQVGVEDELPSTGERLTPSAPPRLRAMRRLRIPRTIHRVWLGQKPMSSEHLAFGENFEHNHPGWKMRLWTDDDLAALDIGATERAAARTQSELSNLVRYEVLAREGGVYVDTDVESRRPLGSLLRGAHVFAGLELPGRVGTAVLGATPGHRVFLRAAREARRTLGLGRHSADANGPYFLSLILEQEPEATIFGPGYFYPYLWAEPERRDDEFPLAYCVHHWSMSWVRNDGDGSG